MARMDTVMEENAMMMDMAMEEEAMTDMEIDIRTMIVI